MLNETITNILFAFTSIILLLSSIQHSAYISNNLTQAEEYYTGYFLSVIITCLFANICLGIFGLFVLGNLSDFIQKMTVNLIGARRKLTVLAILVIVSFLFYAPANLICFMQSNSIKINNVQFTGGIQGKMAMIGILVSVFQIGEVISINLVHPDAFGLKWRKEMKEYNLKGNRRIYYV